MAALSFSGTLKESDLEHSARFPSRQSSYRESFRYGESFRRQGSVNVGDGFHRQDSYRQDSYRDPYFHSGSFRHQTSYRDRPGEGYYPGESFRQRSYRAKSLRQGSYKGDDILPPRKGELELAGGIPEGAEGPGYVDRGDGDFPEDEPIVGPTSQSVPFYTLFRYADAYDIVLMALGTFGAMGNGLVSPLIILIQSFLVNQFGTLSNEDASKISGVIAKFVLYMVYIGIGGWVCSYLELSCWMKTGERQSARIRALYLRSILRQDIGYFDTAESGTSSVVATIAGDSQVLQDAISEKVGNFIATFTQFVGGYVVGFYLSWILTLLAIFMTPLLLLPGLFYKYALTDLAVKRHQAYDKASMIADQAITSIRTVYSYAGEKEVVTNYISSLDGTAKMGRKQGFFKGFAVGATGFGFIIWGVLAWVGSILIINGSRNGGQVLMTGFAILIGGMALGQLAPSLRAFSEGAVAGHRMFSMIERVPDIDSEDTKGLVLDSIRGHLALRNVDFFYPARPEAPIFEDFSLDIPAGKNVALVGASGSGKSTVIALLERFYDPQAGFILIDGHNIRDLNLKWLRRQIGLVSQEPALFATTIKENILYGKENASMEEVMAAAKAANAHDFITSSPEGYDTQVGERGAQLSGGQKQRIAIARAMLKNPPILLLDEATSALDAESERIVQEALEKASMGRTTVTVAHRLSTIQNADIIAVVQKGKVVEMGRHAELLLRGENGAYATLVKLQAARDREEEVHGSAHTSRSNSAASSRSNSFAMRDGKFDPRTLSRGSSRNSSRGSSRRLSFSRSLKRTLSLGSKIGDDVQGDYETLIIDFDAMMPDEEEELPKPSFVRLLRLNGSEWKEGLLGVLGAAGFGFVQPAFAFIIGGMIKAFYTAQSGTTDAEKKYNQDQLRVEVRKYFGVFVGLTFVSLGVNIMQHYYFAAMGEQLTKKIRSKMLTKLLQFEVGWFDLDKNSSGAINARLNTDANQVRSLVGDRISLLVQTASSILVSFILGLAVSWRLAVVLIAIQPLMIFCYSAKKIFLGRFAAEAAQGQADASQVASEAVGQLRTVAAYSSQDKVMALFNEKLEVPRKQINKRSQIAGVGLGASVFIMYASWALAYWYGGQLLSKQQITFDNFFRTFFVLVSSGRILAEAGNLSPDLARGSQAVASVFEILDRETEIDADNDKGEKPTKISGVIELIDVDFAYPSRPYVMVFKKFNLKIRQGKTVAMVGHSGSGKSTIIGLIERFYDPLNGRVLIDNRDLKTYNLMALRKHIGLVSQEPTLFATSIKQNISYGSEDATEAEIMEAAKAANAHSFISALPDGYETYCGERGLQLSGGQKQRIAIARAILKNASILLLDEATSALDAESERIVQDALDRMMKGKTTVVVAHRLATIQNADMIAVIQDGAILEKGTHKELLAKGETGSYYSLVQLQNRGSA